MAAALLPWVRGSFRVLANTGLGSPNFPVSLARRAHVFGTKRCFQRIFSAIARGETVMSSNGQVWHVRPAGCNTCVAIYMQGTYEVWESRLMSYLLKPGMVVVDVGAHAGWFSVLASERVGATGRVYAFEPHPEAFQLLANNLEANRCKNTEAVKLAIWDRPGKVHLFTHPESVSSSSLYTGHFPERGSRPWERTAVEAETLDRFFAPMQRVDFIKMDAEAAEAAVLRGGTRVLSDNRYVRVMAEFAPAVLQKAGMSPVSYLNAFSEMGFQPYVISARGVAPTTPDNLLHRHKKRRDHVNILWYRD